MRLAALAGVLTALATGAASASPGGQILPLDLILPLHHGEPPSADSAALGFTLSAAPLPTATFHPRTFHPRIPAQPDEDAGRPDEPEPDPILSRVRSSASTASPSTPSPSAPPPSTPPFPPARAATQAKPASQDESGAEPAPLRQAAAGPVLARVEARAEARVESRVESRVETLSNREIVERANAYFTGLGTLVADFAQIGGDGRRQGGTLYLQRPGRLRFDYDPPSALEIVADGSSVAVRDRKLATQDLYGISQTPLKFLLREQVRLGEDIAIRGVSGDGDSVRVVLEDSSTLGGTSRITLYFDPKVETLTQWRIVDPQGFQTTVVLKRAERGRRLDPGLFRIQHEAILGGSNR